MPILRRQRRQPDEQHRGLRRHLPRAGRELQQQLLQLRRLRVVERALLLSRPDQQRPRLRLPQRLLLCRPLGRLFGAQPVLVLGLQLERILRRLFVLQRQRPQLLLRLE